MAATEKMCLGRPI